MVRFIVRGGDRNIEAMNFSLVKRRRNVEARRIANITYTIMTKGEVADIFVSSKLYCVPLTLAYPAYVLHPGYVPSRLLLVYFICFSVLLVQIGLFFQHHAVKDCYGRKNQHEEDKAGTHQEQPKEHEVIAKKIGVAAIGVDTVCYELGFLIIRNADTP
jgi:hypothetical protein